MMCHVLYTVITGGVTRGEKEKKKKSFIYLFYSNSLTASFQGGVVAHNRLLTMQCKQLKCIPQI